MDQDNRVVVLIDMDCFYCQVEEKLNPELKGKPIAVVQYNPWKGGGIIAVNYVARALGVTRHMRGDEAKEKCPEIHLPSVPCNNGKADIGTYREAGKEVARVLQKFTPLLERASIDEAYLDITAPVEERLKTLDVSSINTLMMPNTFALGYDSVEEFITDVHGYGNDSIEFDHEHAQRLLVGAVIVSEVRAAVYEETGYRCSAGIAHNKILAKLVCGMNKPNKQTILPKHSVNILYSTLSIKKVKHLGGKFGYQVKDTLKITNMGELQMFSEKDLQNKFDEKDGTWLYNIARGIDLEPVQARFNPKSIGCCKNFKGKSALIDLDNLRKWLKVHGDEVDDRLEKDAIESNRTPKQMVVSFSTQLPDGRDVSSSRSYNFTADDQLCGDLFAAKALELVLDSTEGVKPKEGEANRKLKAPIKFLGISVGKFEDNSESKKTKKILDYFGAGSSNVTKIRDTTKHNETKVTASDGKIAKVNDGKEYILNKFFQVTNKVKIKEETITEPPLTNDKKSIKTDPVIESTLDKQESFFTKFLSGNKDTLRPTTPNCDVINCGENSNDSDYSSSTINNEINKSIALFDEDTQDISRVSQMRELLSSKRIDTETDVNPPGSEENIKDTRERKKHSPRNHKNHSPSGGTTFDCTECRKSLPKAMFETHADYHLALKLRDEERQIARKEKERNTSKMSTNTLNEHVKKKKTEETADKSEQNREHKKHSPKKVSPPRVATFDCPECRKTIPKAMFETHADYHVALKLRDEERQQVRKEKERNIAKTATNTRNENVKKKKTEESVNKNETTSSIASFFVKVDDTVPTESCSECGKKVPLEKLAEHLDFHEAQKLSRELNNRAAPRFLMGNSVKRKRKTVSPVRKPKVPCNKSIDSFFKS